MNSTIIDPFEDSALTTILVVGNMKNSKSFYVDKLGASIYREYGGNSLVLQFLGNWLLLVLPGGPTEDKPKTSFSAPSDINKVSHSFTIRVKNCRESYAMLLKKGIDFLTPPIDRGNETRCFFRDPDGHLFEISEYRS